jgi:hypothetical protein
MRREQAFVGDLVARRLIARIRATTTGWFCATDVGASRRELAALVDRGVLKVSRPGGKQGNALYYRLQDEHG